MKNQKLFLTIYSFIVIFLVSCGEQKPSLAERAEDLSQGEPENAVKIDFASHHYPLSMYIPDSTRGTIDISSENDALQIKVGEIFNISIAYGGNIEEKKAALKDDLLYKYEPISENDGILIYSLTLPDQSSVLYHFYAVKTIDNETYEIQDVVSENPFSKKRIENMVEYIKTLESNKPVS